MADRVRFLTWNDTGTTANSSGANGFPAPFHAHVATFPFLNSFPLDVLIKWFWRSSQWSLSTDFSFTASGVTTAMTQGTMNGGSLNSVGGPMTTELDHVAQSGLGPYIGTNSTEFASANGVAQTVMSLFQPGFAAGNAPVIQESAGVLYPAFFIGGGGQTNPGEPISANISISTDPTGSTGSITGTIDGQNFPLYYATILDAGATFNLTFFDLTIASYWPYAAANGSPIYNTTTGAQLQSPLN